MTEEKDKIPADHASREEDVPIDEIFSDSDFNCRGDEISPGSVADLAEDINTNPIGLMQRIILQPWKHPTKSKIKYRVVAGNRRYTACKLLKWKAIPSRIIEGLSDDDAEIINISENIKRRELNILQEARAIDKMLARGISAPSIAKRLDVYPQWVKARMLLMHLPADVQNEAAAGMIKQHHIEQLAGLYKKDPDKMYEAVRSIKTGAYRQKTIKVKTNAKIADKSETRQFRNMSDVFIIQDICTDAIGTNLASRALAWAIGEISAYEFLQDIKMEADLMGLPWSIPQEYIPKPENKDESKSSDQS